MHFKQDTFRVYSVPIDTVRSDELFQSFIGSLNDPVFGETDAGFYSKILPVSVGHRFGDHPKTDSVILQLYYGTVYGDTNTTFRVHVYEMKDDIHYDSVYYSNKKIAVYPTDYADETFQPHPNNYYLFPTGIDTIMDTVRHVIRLNLSHLSTALGDKLLNADTAILDSNELFMNYFRGLYITVDPVTSGGALAAFITNTTQTVLTVYYRNDTADSLQYSYVMNAYMARINYYHHDYKSGDPDFVKQVVDGDTALGQKKFYVQGLAGVRAIFKFPHIRDLNKLGKVGINEAKLVLPGAEDPPPGLDAPPSLVLAEITSDTTLSQLPDEGEGPDYFGGVYNSETNSYTFRITRYLESLLKDTTLEDRGLALYVVNSSIAPNRFIFNGPEYSGDSARRAQLNILYTIVK